MSNFEKRKLYLAQYDETGEPTYTEIGETKDVTIGENEQHEPQEQTEMSCNGTTYTLTIQKQYTQKDIERMCELYVDEWELERRRELAEFGRSRLAQFGKTHTARQYVKARPYWFRTRSFCVRSPYG